MTATPSPGLREAREDTDGDAREKLLAVGVAYVRFAMENQTRFRVMFRPELGDRYRFGLRRSSESSSAGENLAKEPQKEPEVPDSYQILLDVIEDCQRAGLAAPGETASLALTAWSTVHGLSVLMLDGPENGPMSSADEVDVVAGVVTETLAQGLLLR